MIKSVWYGLAGGLAILMSGTSAFAATVTSQLNVTLTIVNGCGILLTTPVNFGTQNYIATNLSAQGSVQVVCGIGVAYTVGLDGGQAGNINGRQMLNGANIVNYQLYQDAAHTTVWGTAAGTTVAGTGNGLAQTLTVYGLVMAPQAVQAGVYSDTVTVSLTF